MIPFVHVESYSISSNVANSEQASTIPGKIIAKVQSPKTDTVK
jgi:hypothetical protein